MYVEKEVVIMILFFETAVGVNYFSGDLGTGKEYEEAARSETSSSR